MYYKDYTLKIASLLKDVGIKIRSFSEADESVDGEIELDTPNREINIQICPYYPKQGFVINEIVGTGKNLRAVVLETFNLSKDGINLMTDFIKKLQ